MTDLSQQLIDRVQQARNDNQAINIQGRNSKAFLGRHASGEIVSVAEHQGIVNYQPVELVLTARAGTSLAEIEATLAEQGQMLACESPVFNPLGATIGGTLACNQSGPARPWQGSIRDHVLGVKLINGLGEHLRFGGQVMKNVAGYDLSRMQAGAMGTLGLITEVSLKVLPKPAATATLSFPCSAAEAIVQMNRLATEAKPLSAACWLDNQLTLRLSGSQQAVESTLKQWPGDRLEAADKFWQKLREQQLEYFTDTQPLWRFSVKSNSRPIEMSGDWLIDWGGSQRWLKGDYPAEQLQKLAEHAGGQVSLYRGGDRNLEVFHPQTEALKRLHLRLKESMDPQGIFNPGRLYGWL